MLGEKWWKQLIEARAVEWVQTMIESENFIKNKILLFIALDNYLDSSWHHLVKGLFYSCIKAQSPLSRPSNSKLPQWVEHLQKRAHNWANSINTGKLLILLNNVLYHWIWEVISIKTVVNATNINLLFQKKILLAHYNIQESIRCSLLKLSIVF